MIKILIATDSFKDCLSASEAGSFIGMGIQKILPDVEIKLLPVADGGEGSVAILVKATKGKLMMVDVHDPLSRMINSFYGILGDGKTAVIEMAAASGLELLEEKERNPWLTSTVGTGELIKDALNKKCNKIIIGVGGSATNEAGAGMAVALGARLLDKNGIPVFPVGGELLKVHKIDMSGFDKRITTVKFIVASDVKNLLTGPEGASLVYGPQKGADQSMAEKLDKNLVHFSGKIKEFFGKDVSAMEGAGAAGGLGAGLVAFLSAELLPGFDVIKEVIQLEEYVKWADMVVTGEGKIDNQTLYGKTPLGVARIAKVWNKPVIAVTGNLGDYTDLKNNSEFDCFVPIADRPMNLEESVRRAPELLVNVGERIMQLIQIGMNWK